MAELKTQKNSASVDAYLDAIENESRKNDCEQIHRMMQEITGHQGSMWGDSIVGYGSYHYKYESGREGDWMLTGFSSRKTNISVYIMSGFSRFDELLNKLGKHKTGKSCLYIKRLDDINQEVLKEMISDSVSFMTKKYGTA